MRNCLLSLELSELQGLICGLLRLLRIRGLLLLLVTLVGGYREPSWPLALLRRVQTVAVVWRLSLVYNDFMGWFLFVSRPYLFTTYRYTIWLCVNLGVKLDLSNFLWGYWTTPWSFILLLWAAFNLLRSSTFACTRLRQPFCLLIFVFLLVSRFLRLFLPVIVSWYIRRRR